MSVQTVPQPWNIEDKQVQIIEILVTQLTVRGDGTEDNPNRRITQFWTLDGEMICEFDNYRKEPKVTFTTTASVTPKKPRKT